LKFLLDTNVVSEWVKPSPDAGLVSWLAATDEDHIHISVVTIAELHYGIARMARGRRRTQLDHWLREDVSLRFANRILPIDNSVAHAWGLLVAQRETLGKPISPMDAFIAATAEVHLLTLVTRNVADFKPSLSAILNPWSG
jgi:predicted nucleic acid-binding protein